MSEDFIAVKWFCKYGWDNEFAHRILSLFDLSNVRVISAE